MNNDPQKELYIPSKQARMTQKICTIIGVIVGICFWLSPLWPAALEGVKNGLSKGPISLLDYGLVLFAITMVFAGFGSLGNYAGGLLGKWLFDTE